MTVHSLRDGIPETVAVVGAGLAGLACARVLADRGVSVRVFDKARGAGGRMSTRRAEAWHFDHGAQYFTVRDPVFARHVESWRRDGLVASWQGAIAVLDSGNMVIKDDDTGRNVGVPGMNAICRHLAADLDTIYQTRTGALERAGEQWLLAADNGSEIGLYDAVVVSTPAPQTAELFRDAAPALAARAASVEMSPCWAVMAAYPDRLDLGFDGAFVHNSPLSWVARNGSKPGRPEGEAWVLHGSPEWSREHLELDRSEAARRLLEAFAQAAGGLVEAPHHLDAHRWRFALPLEPLAEPCLIDADLRLAACGDWCGGPRVEGAFLSGRAAAERLLAPRS
jgi:predicted NAD/FAD-dependent oxidoreductase